MPSAPKPRRPKSGFPAEKLAIFVGIVLAIYVAFGRTSHFTQEFQEQAQRRVSRNDKIIMLSAEPFLEPKDYQKELDARRAKEALRRDLGLLTLKLAQTGKGLSIPFAIVPKKLWCQAGDLDTMRQAMPDDGGKSLLLSLESMGRSGQADVKSVDRKSLEQGFLGEFSLPISSKGETYSLSICSDIKQTKSCRDKNSVNHQEIAERMAQNPDAANLGMDVVFYFQQLALKGEKLETYRSDSFAPNFGARLEQYLSKNFQTSASEVAAALRVTESLRSAPLDTKDGRLIISLPYNDPRCTQTGP